MWLAYPDAAILWHCLNNGISHDDDTLLLLSPLEPALSENQEGIE
jgi:hypothetical protein